MESRRTFGRLAGFLLGHAASPLSAIGTKEQLMKSLLFSVLALGLVAANPAIADPPRNHPGEHRAVTVHRSVHETVRHPTVRMRTTKPHRTVVHTRRVAPHRRTVTYRTTAHHVTTARRHVTAHRNVNLSRFRKVVRAPHRYRIGAWRAPRGFSYRRFGIGERIPAVLLVADFFLTSYWLYGLEAPPPGYVWVRDGDDAVLVDRYTGEVIEVEYDVFY
jgi:Ni/Co efflux regulator RcnB